MALASLCTILAAASQLTSISTLLEVIFDFRYTLGLIIGVALVLAYITIGGAHADIMANTVQGAIMVICSLICVWLFMDRVGEYGGLMEFGRRLYDYNPDLSPALLFTDPEVSIQYAGVTGVITMVLAHCTFMFMPHVGVKLAALNKQKDMPKVIILVAVIGMCCSVFPALPGFAGILDIPGVEKADMIVPLMFIKFLPKAIAAFLLVGIFAAIISTASGMFLSMAQSISNDIYRQHIAPKMGHSEEKTDKNAVRVAKVSLVCLCVIAVACVWVPPSYLTLFGWIGNGANMAVIAPTIIMSNVYKRTTTKGLLAAQICNLILFAIMYFGFGWTGMMCGGICVVVGCVLTFVFSKVTKNIITKDYLFENGFYTREELERIKI